MCHLGKAYELVTDTSPLSGVEALQLWAAVGLIPYAKRLKYFRRAGATSPLGDLTVAEAKQIQEAVDAAGRRLEVV